VAAALTGLLYSGAAAAADAALPAMRFSGDELGGEFFEQIQRAPLFTKMSREAIGSPIELRVYHTYRINRGGATASGLLAAATLGILPEVSSGEHAVVYEVLVNGVVLSTYKYHRSLTRAHNLWSTDTTHGLGKDGLEWAKSTVDQFVRDAGADAKLTALIAEVDYYFAPAPAPAQPAP